MKRSQLVVGLISATVALTFLELRSRGAVATRATSQPTTAESVGASESPTALIHRYLKALDARDRNAALKCWDTADPQAARIAELQVDLTIAVSRVKKAVRAKFGRDASDMLQMAPVVSEEEFGSVEEHTADPTDASVDVIANNQMQSQMSYPIARSAGAWKLSAAQALKDRPQNVPFETELAMGRKMVASMTATAEATEKGQLNSLDEVMRKTSEALPSP